MLLAMRFLTQWLLLLLVTFSIGSAKSEHVILCGGPALRQWEDLRVERDRHDRWWGNFVRASTIRMDELKIAYGANVPITWIVYRPSYEMRSRADGQPYTKWISQNASKRGAKLIWVTSGTQAISAINRPSRGKIVTFDYFGHSNRYCFMLDYGSEILGASGAWIHENDLYKIKSRAFAPNAQCQSYGCHTAESMSGKWKAAIGIPLIGCTGKTDYSKVGSGQMPFNSSGRWVR